jgi:hypothetical protein
VNPRVRRGIARIRTSLRSPPLRTPPPVPTAGGLDPSPSPRSDATTPAHGTTPRPAPPSTTPEPADPAGRPSDDESSAAEGRSNWVEILGTVGSLLSLFTAVLFYFGWASTDAETRALGLRDTVFQFSTADYLLRSVDALFIPALITAMVALAAMGLHHWIENESACSIRVLNLLRYSGVVPLAAVMLLVISIDLFNLLMPVAILVAVLANTYARTRPEGEGEVRRISSEMRRRRTLRLWSLTLAVAVLALFWAVSTYAGIVGRGRAELTTGTVDRGFPAVVVFSTRDLMIRGGGSCMFKVPEKGSAYQYRYAGLRLFYASAGRLLLVPRYWSPDDGTLFVLQEDSGLRVEYVSGQEARSHECP